MDLDSSRFLRINPDTRAPRNRHGRSSVLYLNQAARTNWVERYAQTARTELPDAFQPTRTSRRNHATAAARPAAHDRPVQYRCAKSPEFSIAFSWGSAFDLPNRPRRCRKQPKIRIAGGMTCGLDVRPTERTARHQTSPSHTQSPVCGSPRTE